VDDRLEAVGGIQGCVATTDRNEKKQGS